MNTLLILCATVISAASANDCGCDESANRPVPAITMEFKGDVTLMQGYERFLTDPQMQHRPQRDA